MKFQQGWELEEFNRMYREMDGIYHVLAKRAGMSDSAFYILYAIAELGDGCSQKEISKRCSIQKQTIHSSVQNLAAKGVLYLSKGKGRDKHIHLTELGERLVETEIYPVMEMEKEAFLGMEPGESQKLLELMEKYIRLFRGKAGW